MIEIEVFLADKLSWKADWSRKLVREIREALKDSKEKAIFHYLSYLNGNKENLQLFHKDSMEAYYYFKRNNVNEYILK